MIWTIRRMTAADIDAVQRVAEEIPELPRWNRAEYERYAVPDNTASLLRAGFVAETPDRLSGFSAGRLGAGVCELESIAVALEAREQGIGKALLRALIEWAEVNQAVRLELEVRASNDAAIGIYGRSGLQREGLRAGYYHAPEEDALLMGMALVPGGKLA